MNAASPDRLRAVLLLGPTGVGKTPLGNWVEAHGLWGQPCHHFDFGANLRAIAAAGPSDRFASDEIQFLRGVLARGALLENESFHLAARILETFVAQRGIQPGHWLVLNGLPRHVGQAQALDERLWVCALIELACDARVIGDRLRRDAGGDRAGRADDAHALVARKLAVYEERTRPLVAHYQQRGARLLRFAVGVETQPREIAEQLGRLDVGA
jgi:adenylate kinase